MNLSAKLKNFGALILGLFFLFSCEELGEFGLGEEDIAPLDFLTTDLSVTGGLVLVDSIASQNTGTLLTGQRNSQFGNMTAKAHSAFYLELNDLIRPRDVATLDSVKMNFTFNYAYDESPNQDRLVFRAYQIAKDFPDTAYVTSSFLAVSDFVIAQEELSIGRVDSTYSLTVDPTWANEVFEGLKDATDIRFNDLAEFRKFFPGVQILPEGAVNNIYGITPGEDLEIRFYFSEPASDGSGLVDNKEIAINGEFSPHFFSFDVDRSATPYNQIQEPAVEYPVGQKMLVHAGAGVVTKINLKELSDFTEQNENVIVNLVEMTIGPIDELAEGVDPPEQLLLYYTDDQNTTILDNGNFRGIQQDGVNILSSQFPVRLTYDSETRTYKNSITSYVQNYYNDIFRRDFVFMYPADMNVSANAFELDPSMINIKIFYSELR